MSSSEGLRRFTVLVAAGGLLAVAGVAAPAGAQASHSGAGFDDGYQQINLVSDIPGAAQLLDPNLVNAWGLSSSPTSPLWVSDNGTDKSTLYTGAVAGQPANIVPLVVTIPGGGAPTGQVFNSTDDFLLPTGGKALFIFAGEHGELSAWNGAQGTTAALVAPSRGGIYKGLALVGTAHGNRLLAANFHDNRIDVFNGSFQRVNPHGAFRGVGIPHGYAPFNVAVLGNRVYVSYAKQDANREDDVAGAGHGFINVFTPQGRFLQHLARRGVLNSPWAITVAPPGFGDFSGDLLIGNFGDGRIHAFTPSGHLAGTLRDTHGNPLVIEGLWALKPGNGVSGATSDVWFSAGPGDESHGLLGILHSTDDD
ncbi:MAG: TIGR03118 family protein [Jatrophihabitantaceae bacterium]